MDAFPFLLTDVTLTSAARYTIYDVNIFRGGVMCTLKLCFSGYLCFFLFATPGDEAIFVPYFLTGFADLVR